MLELSEYVGGAVCVGTRVSGLMIFTPFPGGAAAPMQVKAGMTFAMTALLWPVVGTSAGVSSPGRLLLSTGSELALGALLGLTVNFVFEAAQLAGHYAGLQVGFSLVNVIDPQTQVETPVLGTLHQLIVLLIFLQLNVHHWLIRGMAKSFEYIPSTTFVLNGPIVENLLHAAGGIFVAGIQIAAPILMATMIADVALGFVSKASPQLQVMLLGFPIKTMLALIVWMGAVALWPSRMDGWFVRAVGLGEGLLHLAR
jgi:flagellar biosynthetic protein FliR